MHGYVVGESERDEKADKARARMKAASDVTRVGMRCRLQSKHEELTWGKCGAWARRVGGDEKDGMGLSYEMSRSFCNKIR